jgi:protein-disulfide isomerase
MRSPTPMKFRRIITLCAGLAVAAAATAGVTDTAAPETTEQKLSKILQELTDLRAVQEKQQAQLAEVLANARPHKKIAMNVSSDWHVLGNANAPVTVVEFADLECPFCRRFEHDTLPGLKADYIDSGQVRFVSMDLPLAMHFNARQAAEAINCAGDQGRFWELRAALLRNPDSPTKDMLLESATPLGIDRNQFQDCLDSGKYRNIVAAQAETAAALHIHATPTFAIGRISNGKLTGIELEGALDYSRFKTEIDNLLQDP